MNDISVRDLMDKVQAFCEERDWDQFHNPKELAIGISTEANELLEIFRFKSEEQMKELFLRQDMKEHIEDEVADTFFFILRFAQINHLDLCECIYKKLEKNNKKYPVDIIKGKNLKYTELSSFHD